ncbi:MAG: hypothetical protein EXX96DRAFT_574552 [Benjaminiella poitrasii]|nr:MAG: hypothetical protein EXX96DRAFT_574552 [Benjaminiella poitrasii]
MTITPRNRFLVNWFIDVEWIEFAYIIILSLQSPKRMIDFFFFCILGYFKIGWLEIKRKMHLDVPFIYSIYSKKKIKKINYQMINFIFLASAEKI